MSHDGSDLVPALASIMEDVKNPQRVRLRECVDEAFPGSTISIDEENGRLSLQMRSPGISRPLELKELSDGTLQYFCLLAALLSPVPPAVLALNEPETSIHPDLLKPLARLVVDASKNSQIWITTHSQDLSDYILDMSGYEPLELKKVDGETKLVGVGLGGYKEDDEDDLDEDEDE
jgi:predicted ATPase